MKFEIKSRLTGSVLFSIEADSMKLCVEAAIKSLANLSGASLYAWAQVGWNGHGECGRTLTAIRQTKNTGVRFYCGCFRGTETELLAYIAGGEDRHKASRTLCLETVLMLMKGTP